MTEQTAPRRSYAVVMVTAAGATFLAMLDSTVTNLVVPALHHDFPSASVAGLSWVIISYVVMFAALLASAGRLADVVGRRVVFLAGVAVFTVASLGSALAPDLPLLVVARAVQGMGAALMIPAALAVLLLDGPAERRTRAIALWSASSAVAAALGPAVGGLLVDWLSWRAVFYVNLPLGVAILVAAVRILPRQPRRAGSRLPDAVGTVLLVAGIGALTLGVSEGVAWHWNSLRTLSCLVGGLVAVVLAVWRSTRAPVPAVETELWGNRTFLVANLVSLLYGMAQFPWLLGTVLYITDLWRYSELRAGLAMTPGALAASAAALLIGRMTTGRLRGARPAAIIGLLAFLVGGLWIVPAMTVHPSFLTLILPISVIAGGGMGLITFGTSMAAALSAPAIRFAGASGMNTMARQFGGALGVAGLAVILQTGTARGVNGYQHVYLFCTVLVAVALVLAWAALRLSTPPSAPAGPISTPAQADGARSPLSRLRTRGREPHKEMEVRP